MSLRPASTIAWHSASNRATSSVMLSSTRKIARAPRAARVGDVGDHARRSEAVEVAPAHLDDRAEAAVEGAAARGLDDVDLAAEQRVAGEHAGAAVRQLDVGSSRPADRARRGVCANAVGRRRYDSPAIAASRRAVLERAQQLAEREVAFAADDEVDAAVADGSYASGARLGS